MNQKMILTAIVVIAMLAAATLTFAQGDKTLPLADYGPYRIGRMDLTLIDESRGDWEIDVIVWYPAITEEVTPGLTSVISYFSMAFFGYYLQDLEGYVEYLTEDYVQWFEDLTWGVYEE